ncbi:pectinesterase [Selaginella moellendorffii]|nr:pectinesterase [Selaginella moellendorffii]|eukprot:XP_002982718.2 pectinesterase [Selaginella moellendorffii]
MASSSSPSFSSSLRNHNVVSSSSSCCSRYCLRNLVFLLFLLCAANVVTASGDDDRGRNLRAMNTTGNISLVCQATQFPDVCYSSLVTSPGAANAKYSQQLVGISITIAYQGVNESDAFADQLIQESTSDVSVKGIARDCKDLLTSSKFWLQECVASDLDKQVQDMQQWLSGVLTYQTDCTSSLSVVKKTKFIKKMMHKLESVARLISNALSMVDAFASYGSNPQHWKRPTLHKRKLQASLTSSSFSVDTTSNSAPSWLGMHDRRLLEAPASLISPSAIVSRTPDQPQLTIFTSIQAAVDHAPNHCTARYVIYIKAGVYAENVRIPLQKSMLMFVGDGMDKTIIRGSMSVSKGGTTTFASATLAVNGKGFLARDLTVENTAGPEGHQAVALRVDSDMSAFHSCSILGYQDTLYAHTFRQFYRDCRIEGTIDFIFGNAAAVLQNCLIRVRPGNPGVILSTVTAQGRLDPAQPTGLVFQNCTVNGTEEYMRGLLAEPRKHLAYLGRPWKLYSRTIFLHTYMESLVRPEGWLPWDGNFALATLYFAEYLSCGPGASAFSRVPWSTQLSIADALGYTVQSFIQGDSWLPSTNIPFFHFI